MHRGQRRNAPKAGSRPWDGIKASSMSLNCFQIASKMLPDTENIEKPVKSEIANEVTVCYTVPYYVKNGYIEC